VTISIDIAANTSTALHSCSQSSSELLNVQSPIELKYTAQQQTLDCTATVTSEHATASRQTHLSAAQLPDTLPTKKERKTAKSSHPRQSTATA